MQLVVDPAQLTPPRDDEKPDWLRRMRGLLSLASDGGVQLTCPKALRDSAYALWFAGGNAGELVRFFGEVADRMEGSPPLPDGPVLLDNITTEPTYVHPQIKLSERDVFVDHLGEAAVAKDDGEDHLGIFTEEQSWSEQTENVLVEASVDSRESPGGEWFEPESDLASVRAFLGKTATVDDLLRGCCTCPEHLIMRVKFGVMAVWVGELEGRAQDLKFDVGPALEKSIANMNYASNRRYASSCLRVMALIAGGRSNEVNGHEERAGAGGNNPVVRDREGKTVMRAYLARKSPDANRLFWVRGPRPKFLNVTGHEGRPAL
jgi:hypothetical protein